MGHATTQSQLTPGDADALSAARPPTWRLHVVASPDRRWSGRVVVLADGAWVIGRETDGNNPLCMQDAALSRRHCELRVHGASVEMADLGSRNGSHAAGRPVQTISAGHGAVLRWGDTVAVLEADHGRAQAFDQPTEHVPGRSELARMLRGALDDAARSRHAVLLQGATGTGKEFAAQELHRRSGRRGRLVRINAAAVPETLFESQFFGHLKGAFTGAQGQLPGFVREAHGGTLVLDEIGEMALNVQAKLLRLLEEGKVRPVGAAAEVAVDVRYVASTNADLDAMARAGTLRPDLLARLQLHRITLPRLDERRADLLALADAVAESPDPGRPWSQVLDARSVERLLVEHYPWNIRSLQAILVRTAARIRSGDAPRQALRASLPVAQPAPSGAPPVAAPPVVAPPPQKSWRPDMEQLRALLREHRGNIERVAQATGRERRQVYRWLEQAGIDEAELARWRGE